MLRLGVDEDWSEFAEGIGRAGEYEAEELEGRTG